MKRRTVRLMVFSGAGLAVLIAVAQAHYGRDATSKQPVSAADEADVSTPLTAHLASPFADDRTSTSESADAEPEPAGGELLAMADDTSAASATGDRYAPVAMRASDPRESAASADLPSAARETAAPPAVIGRLPARPRDRTMQPDRLDRPTVPPLAATTDAATDADRPTNRAAPHLAPFAAPRTLEPGPPRSGSMPEPTEAPNRLRPDDRDPFQADAQFEASGPAAVRPAPLPAASAEVRAGSIDEGTGLPGAADLEGPQAPSLTLEKRAAAEIQVGKECTFEIRIRNTGQVPAHGVTVRDEIPQKTRLVTCQPRATESAGGELRWDLGTLNIGEEATIEMHLLPVAEGEVGSVASVEFHSRASVRTVVTKPELAVRMSGPDKVMIGDDVPIQIEISNPGSGAATGVILLEDVPAGLGHPAGERLELELGTIPPGQQRQLRLVLTAKQAGLITNRLTVRADANLSVEASVDLEVIAPELKVGIDGPKRRFLDRPATYTLALENPGTATATDVELAAYLPKGMKFVEANNHGQYDAATHSVIWGLEELPAHERGSVQLVALPVEAGNQMLRVEGRAAQGLTDQAQRDITVEGVAAIKFEVVDSDDPIEVGGETNYKIHVVNQGSKAATQVQIVILIPTDMKAIAASGPTQHAMEADRVVFAPLRRLASKADTTYQIKVQGLSPGDHRLRVQLLTDEIRRPVTKEESTQVYADE
jgi:uncharacterized repeat protein (TIGR01451 family)